MLGGGGGAWALRASDIQLYGELVSHLWPALSQVSVAVNVECVTVKPTARAEHASAAGTLMAV